MDQQITLALEIVLLCNLNVMLDAQELTPLLQLLNVRESPVEGAPVDASGWLTHRLLQYLS